VSAFSLREIWLEAELVPLFSHRCSLFHRYTECKTESVSSINHNKTQKKMSETSLFKSFGFSISSISENRRIPNNSKTPWVLIPGGQKVRTFLQRKTTVFESKTVVFMWNLQQVDTLLQLNTMQSRLREDYCLLFLFFRLLLVFLTPLRILIFPPKRREIV